MSIGYRDPRPTAVYSICHGLLGCIVQPQGMRFCESCPLHGQPNCAMRQILKSAGSALRDLEFEPTMLCNGHCIQGPGAAAQQALIAVLLCAHQNAADRDAPPAATSS